MEMMHLIKRKDREGAKALRLLKFLVLKGMQNGVGQSWQDFKNE